MKIKPVLLINYKENVNKYQKLIIDIFACMRMYSAHTEALMIFIKSLQFYNNFLMSIGEFNSEHRLIYSSISSGLQNYGEYLWHSKT